MIKRLIAIFICLSFVFSITAVYAAPVGNIAAPAMLKSEFLSKNEDNPQIGFVAGGEFDITRDRKIKDDVGKTSYNFYGSKLGIIFADRAMVYGLLGGANSEWKYRDEGSDVKIKTKTDFAWGVGATVILYEKDLEIFDNTKLRFGVDGRYRQSKLDVDKVIIDGVTHKVPSGDVSSLELEYQDWQVAGAVSFQGKLITPYVGVKYSDMKAKGKATVAGVTYESDSTRARKKFGVFVGGDIVMLDFVSLNVEGRFIDEEALTLGCMVRF
jgi:hypothetical protein